MECVPSGSWEAAINTISRLFCVMALCWSFSSVCCAQANLYRSWRGVSRGIRTTFIKAGMDSSGADGAPVLQTSTANASISPSSAIQFLTLIQRLKVPPMPYSITPFECSWILWLSKNWSSCKNIRVLILTTTHHAINEELECQCSQLSYCIVLLPSHEFLCMFFERAMTRGSLYGCWPFLFQAECWRFGKLVTMKW